jgi:hypothetical protein
MGSLQLILGGGILAVAIGGLVAHFAGLTYPAQAQLVVAVLGISLAGEI